jgi:predicted RNase H-like HicB family nuclease
MNQLVFSDYLRAALDQAQYAKLEDASYVGRIPTCRGVIAFAKTLHGCQRELRSVLEDWGLLGIKLNHPLPIIRGINLNHN